MLHWTCSCGSCKSGFREALLNFIEHEYILPVANTKLSANHLITCLFLNLSEQISRGVWWLCGLKGRCINHSIHSGPALLNKLSYVLVRFEWANMRWRRILANAFFTFLLLRDHRVLFRILWFSNKDIEIGELQSFYFTRHCVGSNKFTTYWSLCYSYVHLNLLIFMQAEVFSLLNRLQIELSLLCLY